VIPASGWRLRERLSAFDAARRFGLAPRAQAPPGECISGEILRGLKKPFHCPAFGARCTPEHPIGAPMVSSEGACAAYFRYRARQKAPSAA
jgi:hydrogenase expression/formation protein HypD